MISVTFPPLAHNLNVSVEAASFGELWERHSASVYRFALYLSGDESAAQDITSETFLRVWSTRDRLEMETVKGYLLAIARNLFLQGRRRDWRSRPIEEAPEGGAGGVAESRAELREVMEAMAELSELDRTLLLLRAEDGLSYEEIARVVRLPLATVKVKIHRARLRLAEKCGRSVRK